MSAERALRSPRRLFRDAIAFAGALVGAAFALRKLRSAGSARSESHFREIIELAPDAIFVADSEGRYTHVNRAACQMLGYDRDELVGMTIHDLTPVEDAARLAATVEELRVRGGQASTFEWRLRRKDGTFVPVELSGNIRSDGRMQAIARDITARKRAEEEAEAAISVRTRAEEAMQTSEREFHSLAESMPQIVWITTADGANTYFNQQWMDYTGLTLEESYGDGWIIPFHPDDRERAWDAWQRATKQFASYDVECRLRRADGVYRWWLIRGAPVLGPGGQIHKWFGTCTDIEDIKVGAQRLERIEKEQRLLAEAGTVLAASLDYEQTLVSVAHLVVRDFADWCIINIVEGQEIKRLKVASADPAQADLCAELEQASLDRERPYLLRAVIEQKRPLLTEHISLADLEAVAHGPAQLRALRAMNAASMMALPLLRSGQLLGALAFISSAPGRRYGPDDLRLAEALAERAALAIENARLFKASVEAAELRDEVLGFVAHDLRNPLNVITIQASLLRRKGPEPERRSRRPGERIERAAARMDRLIQDILDISRMEGGHLWVDQARVAADQLLVDSVDAQSHLAAAASIELELASGMRLPDVWVDRDRVLQVFENLIANAIKFTKPGGRITVGAAVHDGAVVFAVKDTGAGISLDELPHVFDRFWQAKKTGRAGAGLGLQIVKGIVEAHGGHIWVESTLGVGTAVYFALPTAHSVAARPASAELH